MDSGSPIENKGQEYNGKLETMYTLVNLKIIKDMEQVQ